MAKRKYGDKRDYQKRDIYGFPINEKGVETSYYRYLGSTTWAKTNAEAVRKYNEGHSEFRAVYACVDRKDKR